MAHANPEFALGLMRKQPGPVRHHVQTTTSAAQLRRRIDAIALMPAAERTPADQRALDAWLAFSARTRGHEPAFDETGPAMHGGDAKGMRFVEPKRRWPADVQSGRPNKPRRSILPR